MTKKTVLITGCSRGIGLGLVKEFLIRQYNVIATCRNPSKAEELMTLLEDAGQHKPLECDISSDSSIQTCKELVHKFTDHLDILINNAGISNKEHPVDPPSRVRRDEFLEIMNTNVAGTCIMTQAFLPLLKKSQPAKVINISSGLGSTQRASNINSVSYRCSKSALNMLSKIFCFEFPDIIFASVAPGWVQTDMGKAKNRQPPVTIKESTKAMVDIIENITYEKSGSFIDYTGEELPF